LKSKDNAAFLKLCKWIVTFVATMFCASFVASASPGDLDPSYAAAGVLREAWVSGDGRANAITVQPDGKTLVAGNCPQVNIAGFCVFRYDNNGQRDPSFNLGVSANSSYARAVATGIRLQSDGKIIVSGDCPFQAATAFCVARLLADGQIDLSFGASGRTEIDVTAGFDESKALIVQPDDRIVIAGSCSTSGNSGRRFCAVRTERDGLLDASFASSSARPGVLVLPTFFQNSDIAAAAVQQLTGKIVIAGRCDLLVLVSFCFARLTSLGELDPTFSNQYSTVPDFGSSPGVIPGTVVFGFSVPSQGHVLRGLTVEAGSDKLIAVGPCGTTERETCVAKLLADGEFDESFGGGRLHYNFVSGEETFEEIAVDSSGKLLVLGYCLREMTLELCATRLLANGAIDISYGNNGFVSHKLHESHSRPTALAIVENDKAYVAGGCYGNNGQLQVCLARLKGGPYDASLCSLNADLNNQVAGTDGVLAIRYLLGYTGDALTDGALGVNPGRNSQQIESHLAQLKTDGKLDVDGDGEVNAMTDGLLILRAMLGLSGEALVAGARNASHPNVRDARQILTWIESTHGVACLP
jgi:uncharacterized delta-60 repeat protein